MSLHPEWKAWRAFHTVAILQAASSALAILVFGYQGIFTRYMADDYCNAVLFGSGHVLRSLVHRYLSISDRFSNILFVGAVELFGPVGVRFMPALMLGLWLAGLTWLAGEIRRTFRLRWPPVLDVALAGLLVFVSVLGAPNRFQIFFWRSGMSTHLAPIVFLSFLLAFLLSQARRAWAGVPQWWTGPAALLGAFAIGGFSEPPALVMIAAAGMALAVLWIWGRSQRAARILTAWTLAGALLALLVMFLAPGNSFRLGTPPPTLPVLAMKTMLYTYQFMLDTVRSMPLPTFFALVMPALFFVYLCLRQEGPAPFAGRTRRGWSFALLIPLILYVLIGASFAPSVYGQSFPVERARFAGYFLQMTAWMLEGALLGTLSALWIRDFPPAGALRGLALILLGLAAVYPLRAAWLGYMESADFREWAAAWDARDAAIRAEAAAGRRDLVVPGLSGVGYVKELDIRPGQWVNRCAAQYYGVDSISAPPFGP